MQSLDHPPVEPGGPARVLGRLEEVEEARVAVLGAEPALALRAQPADLLARDEDLAHVGVDLGLATVPACDADDGVDVVGDAALDGAQEVAALGEGGRPPGLLRGARERDGLLDFFRRECFDRAEIVHGTRVPASNFVWTRGIERRGS